MQAGGAEISTQANLTLPIHHWIPIITQKTTQKDQSTDRFHRFCHQKKAANSGTACLCSSKYAISRKLFNVILLHAVKGVTFEEYGKRSNVQRCSVY